MFSDLSYKATAKLSSLSELWHWVIKHNHPECLYSLSYFICLSLHTSFFYCLFLLYIPTNYFEYRFLLPVSTGLHLPAPSLNSPCYLECSFRIESYNKLSQLVLARTRLKMPHSAPHELNRIELLPNLIQLPLGATSSLLHTYKCSF